MPASGNRFLSLSVVKHIHAETQRATIANYLPPPTIFIYFHLKVLIKFF